MFEKDKLNSIFAAEHTIDYKRRAKDFLIKCYEYGAANANELNDYSINYRKEYKKIPEELVGEGYLGTITIGGDTEYYIKIKGMNLVNIYRWSEFNE